MNPEVIADHARPPLPIGADKISVRFEPISVTEQPEPEVPVLRATTERLVETSSQVEERAPKDDRVDIERALPGVSDPVDDGPREDATPSDQVTESGLFRNLNDLTVDTGHRWVVPHRCEAAHGVLERRRDEHVVRIEEHHHVRVKRPEPGVARGREPAVGAVAQQSNPVVRQLEALDYGADVLG